MKLKIQLALILLLLISLFTLTSPSAYVYAYTGNGDIIVHVTYTGACYHEEGCGSLRSDIPIALEDAYIEGYQRCDRCFPPAYTGTATRNTEKEKHYSNGTKKSTSKTVSPNKKEKSNWRNNLGFIPLIICIFLFVGCPLIIAIKEAVVDKIMDKIRHK